MLPHAYLPKRKIGTGNRFLDPQAPGVWDERDAQLSQLADGIEIPSEPQRIYSIPDPWARALLFDRALYDEQHKLHSIIVGEWRGLIALIGLRESRDLESLSVRPVSLTAGRPDSFVSVLRELLPRDVDMLSAESNWQNFHILRWQLRPWRQTRAQAFGFTSPMTLVATGAEYSGLIAQDEAPWFDGQRLVDPTPHLSGRERNALAEWLLAISRELTRQVTKGFRKGRIVDMVNQFAGDLDSTARPPAHLEDVVSQILLMGFHDGIYRILDRPLKGETRSVSDVEIRTTENERTPVLFD